MWIWAGLVADDAPAGRVIGIIVVGLAWAAIALGVIRHWRFAGVAGVALGSIHLAYILVAFMQDFWWLLLVAADVVLILGARRVAHDERAVQRA